MTYRDELEAALHRANESERALAEERAQSAVKDREIAVLRAQVQQMTSQLATVQPAYPPQPYGANVQAAYDSQPHPVAKVLQSILWVAVVIAGAVVLAAGSQRERDGVMMAQLLAFVPGAAIAGHLTRKRPLPRYFASIVLGAVASMVLVAFFFAAIWPSL